MKRFIGAKLLYILLFIINSNIFGQVTIGSDIEPISGALLDLKENTAVGVNASRGLGLPRVELIEIDKLFPMFNEISGTNYKDISGNIYDKATQDETHTGLTVYNTKEGCIGENYIYLGTYVWDGKRWVSLKKEDEYDVRSVTYGKETINADGQILGSFTMTYIDKNDYKEKNIYSYASFGDAGIWMTQNLDTKYAPSGKELVNNVKSKDIGVGKHNYAYPSSTNFTDPSDYEANLSLGFKVGLLYDWYTATESDNCIINDQAQAVNFGLPWGENEVENKNKKGFIKGICPTGWHLPSDRECNRLEKHLTENAAKLTQTPVTPSTAWTTGWETQTGSRGSIAGTVMTSKAMIANSAMHRQYANSKPPSEGGFYGLLSGGTITNSYDGHLYFWSSSSKSKLDGWLRHASFDNKSVDRKPLSKTYLLPVRCVKD